MQALTDPGGLYFSTSALAVSSDGYVVLGFGEGRVKREAFRWTAADGMLGLGPMFEASSVSADGSVIVGRSELPGVIVPGEPTPPPELYVWTEGRGTRLLTDVLVNDCGLDISGWTLGRAMLVSPDGQTIVGTGLNPAGQLDVWTATLPEPSTLALGVVGALMLIRRRRGRRV
jgi:hypothetical protein